MRYLRTAWGFPTNSSGKSPIGNFTHSKTYTVGR